MPKVVNVATYTGPCVYVGRPSMWGNPFSHKEGTLAEYKVGSREEAIDRFESYLDSNEFLLSQLWRLHGKDLACWCYPKKCHANILLRRANA